MTGIAQANTHNKYLQTLQNRFRISLSELADIAEERGVILTFSSTATDSGELTSQKRQLSNFLRYKLHSIDEPYKLAVVGEFSRGKSTLINALLGKKILTNDYRPNTATQTILRYGVPEKLRITYQPELKKPPLVKISHNLLYDLAQFTSDSSTGQKASDHYANLLKDEVTSLTTQIEKVEVWCDSDFLKTKRLEIIDTPGLGSLFKSHKLVTDQVIPTVDATLLAIQLDPGVSQSEVAFIRYIREYIDRLFFVMTKADMIPLQELPERIHYARLTIEAVVGMTVEHIYPVAAQRVLENSEASSSFSDFVEALETFLIKSSGVARMTAPLRLAMNHCQQMRVAVERDIAYSNHSCQELEQALVNLAVARAEIMSRQRSLFAEIDKSIQGIIFIITEDISVLASIIGRAVEEELDKLNGNQLEEAEIYLQPVIKNVVAKWLQHKRPQYEASITALNRRVQCEVASILKTIQFDIQKIDLEETIEFQLDMTVGLSHQMGRGFGNAIEIGENIVKQLTYLGASVNISPNFADKLTLMTDRGKALLNLGKKIAINTTDKLDTNSTLSRSGKEVGHFLSNLRDKAADAIVKTRDELTRNWLRQALLKPIPGVPLNTYEAMVYGYNDSKGQRIVGLRDTIEQNFTNWSKNLEGNIAMFIENSLTTRANLLKRQVSIERGDQREIQNVLEIYLRQKAQLDEIYTTLQELLATLITFN